MNKTELISAIAKKTGSSLKETGQFLDAAILSIEEAIGNGGEVSIMKFGTFYTSFVQGREGVSPLDESKKISIPDSYRVYFKAGKDLKEAANKQLKKSSKK